MASEIKVGDYVRNKISGNFGEVMEFKKGFGSSGPFDFVRVLVVKEPITKYTSLWMRKNIEIVNGVTK